MTLTKRLLLRAAACSVVVSIASVSAPAFAQDESGDARGATEEDAPKPAPPAPAVYVRGLAGGGASTASLFGISSSGGHLEGGLAVEQGHVFIPFLVNVEIGKTSGGLSAGEVTAGAGVMGVIASRVRLGGGVDLGYGWLGRASTSIGSFVGMYALDAFLLGTVDLLEIGDHRAVYVGVKPSIGTRWGESFFAWDHGTVAWRGVATAGLRF